ncbi:MAG TPA: hypothetical protein VJN21_07135 [Candidatus Acidoferrales bacterium]|nr:hypothetical protein [Candidatus Acidoferrales bacterium]
MARIILETPVAAYFIARGFHEQWYSQGGELVRPVFSVTCKQWVFEQAENAEAYGHIEES